MPLTLTARRTAAAREIKASLAEAEAELEKAGVNHRESLKGLITALRERLHNRRSVVLAARYQSLQRGIQQRLLRRRHPTVWGFPTGYNPNINELRCEICRQTDTWTGRHIPTLNTTAWTCSACPAPLTEIPQN